MAKKGTKLNDQQKRFIVQRLACFDTPSEVAASLQEEFGIKVAQNTIHYYDPTKKHAARAGLAKQWIELFEQARKDFFKDTESHVPIANKAVRLREMQKAYQTYKARGNLVAAMQVLEQVAKEMGNVHTNRREISGRDGKPIEYADMSEEQLDARLIHLLQGIGVSVADNGDGADAGDGNSPSVH